jgi:hypothetical protein
MSFAGTQAEDGSGHAGCTRLGMVISKKASCSSTQLESLRFAIAGRVTAWDPIERRLQMGQCDFWVVPTVSVSDVVPAAVVMVMGHVEPPEPRWIVTVLKLDD